MVASGYFLYTHFSGFSIKVCHYVPITICRGFLLTLQSMNFSETELNEYVLDALDIMGFHTCTPIQEASLPPLIEGKDLIGVAQTGTGKTAAFLLPVLNELSYGDYPQDKINCLIMAPTRELAKQIDEQLQGFSYFVPVSSSAVYGGNDGPEFSRQRQGLKMGADIIVATPGRLISHISMGYVDLSQVSFFILDEADRMLDMGFYDDIMQIASFLPKDRQTIMFSATMPPKIQKLASNILHNPVRVEIAVSKPAENICQQAIYCYETQKLNVVSEIFASMGEPERCIIFASSKLKVKELARTLRQKKYTVAEMHSDLDQATRDEVMHQFKNGTIKLLVATDIVARGIDIDDIAMVMNYDVPREAEDYVHRIGRTARAGASGRAVTLVNDKDLPAFRRIEKFLGKEIEKMSPACLEGSDFQIKTADKSKSKPRKRNNGRRNLVTKNKINANDSEKTLSANHYGRRKIKESSEHTRSSLSDKKIEKNLSTESSAESRHESNLSIGKNKKPRNFRRRYYRKKTSSTTKTAEQ